MSKLAPNGKAKAQRLLARVYLISWELLTKTERRWIVQCTFRTGGWTYADLEMLEQIANRPR